jgi:type II secretory pathway pseudopilin PulG
MTHRPQRIGSAFSLLELLVASVILAAGLVVVLQGISLGVRSSASSGTKATAYRLADDRLHRAAVGELAGGDSGQYHADGGSPLEWRLESGAYDRGCRRLRCVVTWRATGRERQVELSRLILETGQ